MPIRSPIVSVLGHVDHGKSSILDSIRGSCIIDREAGKITQAIGASILPIETIKEGCKKFIQDPEKIKIPGLLFIDTPGHSAFTTLRKRGGSLADIAILVIDINEGIMPQTEESINILLQNKTPFVIALNKLDLVHGFQQKEEHSVLKIIESQFNEVKNDIEGKIYDIVGKLYDKFKIEADFFNRIDFTKKVAIVPCSAKTKIGLPELMMVIIGLSQKYLKDSLEIHPEEKAKGTILEVKEIKGHGCCIDTIIYDGILNVDDNIMIAGLDNVIETKVRALLKPKALNEIMDRKSKFDSVDSAEAATALRISAPGMEKVLSGMPFMAFDEKDREKTEKELREQVEEVIIDTDKSGVVVKTDSLGSLEAMITILKENNILIKKASIGNISKKDFAEAESNYEQNPLDSVILGFNVKDCSETSDEKVKIIIGDIIYKIVEDLEEWKTQKIKEKESMEKKGLEKPFKIQFLRNTTFRKSHPAIIGVDVLEGTLVKGMSLMNEEGKLYNTTIKSLQEKNKSVEEAPAGKQVAVSLPDMTVGRQIHEEDIFYSFIDEKTFRKLKEKSDYLNDSEKNVLRKIAKIMRKNNPVWGV
ncbi:translation initiation factor IF-2 [Candidatus Woesearchaeota archaeon]|nr:translation initiation factor IF-2 [Candidatus Woesearchaeota archaeon]